MSNPIKNSPEVRVVLAGFAPAVRSWQYSHAGTPTWRFYWNPEPGAWLVSHGEKIDLVPETAVLIPPRTPFATGAEGTFPHFYVHFTFGATCVPERRRVIRLRSADVLLPGIRRDLPRFSPEKIRFAAAAAVNAALLELPGEFFTMKEESHEESFFEQAVDIFEEDLSRTFSCEELARRCGTSVNTLQRQFLASSGLPVKKWLLNRKMECAVRLLLTEGRSIKETASLLGFADRYHFSKSFKLFFGMPPARFVKSGGAAVPGDPD